MAYNVYISQDLVRGDIERVESPSDRSPIERAGEEYEFFSRYASFADAKESLKRVIG